jgi:hypothetical protein
VNTLLSAEALFRWLLCRLFGYRLTRFTKQFLEFELFVEATESSNIKLEEEILRFGAQKQSRCRSTYKLQDQLIKSRRINSKSLSD